jgi:hypothetical protein
VQQLRGKKIGTGGVGSLAEILTRRILVVNHVRPEDVTILATGPKPRDLSLAQSQRSSTPRRCNALTFTAQDEGFRKLVAARRRLSTVQVGLATTSAMLSEQPSW